MDQANRKVVPRVGTIASHLRDFTRMNRLTFYGSKDEEYHQEFIDEIYKILYAIRLTTSDKDGFPLIKSRTWYVQ